MKTLKNHKILKNLAKYKKTKNELTLKLANERKAKFRVLKKVLMFDFSFFNPYFNPCFFTKIFETLATWIARIAVNERISCFHVYEVNLR